MPDINEPTEAALELGEKLKVPNVEFDAWVASMPAKHWSKYDLSACRLGWEAARRVAPAPSFADGIEAAGWTHTKDVPSAGGHYIVGGYVNDGVLPRRFEKGWAFYRATLDGPEWSWDEPEKHGHIPMSYWVELPPHPEHRALAHNPQASSEYEKCATCNGTGLRLNMAGEPDECLDCKGNTVVPAERSGAAEGNEAEAAAPPECEGAPAPKPLSIIYTNWRGETAERKIMPNGVWFGSTEWHPEPQWLIKATDIEKGAERDFAWSGIRFQSAAPKPDPAIAELVEGLRELLDLNYLPDEPCRVGAKTVEKAIAALTASNDRVAELERERDEANRDRVTWAYNAGHSADELLRTQRALKAAERERDAAFKLAHEWAAKAGGADVRAEAAEAAEAEVSRLKADIARKEAALLAFASEENWRQGGAFDPNSPSFCGIGIASAALSNQAGASK